MGEITLTRGRVALVDDADVAALKIHKWIVTPAGPGKVYATARIRGENRKESMHRFLMRPPKGMVVHHVNNDGLDNRRSNLAVVPQSANLAAHHDQFPSGVHFHKQTGKWRAQVRLGGTRRSLGLFPTEALAIEAVQAARTHWHSLFPLRFLGGDR